LQRGKKFPTLGALCLKPVGFLRGKNPRVTISSLFQGFPNLWLMWRPTQGFTGWICSWRVNLFFFVPILWAQLFPRSPPNGNLRGGLDFWAPGPNLFWGSLSLFFTWVSPGGEPLGQGEPRVPLILGFLRDWLLKQGFLGLGTLLPGVCNLAPLYLRQGLLFKRGGFGPFKRAGGAF